MTRLNPLDYHFLKDKVVEVDYNADLKIDVYYTDKLEYIEMRAIDKFSLSKFVKKNSNPPNLQPKS